MEIKINWAFAKGTVDTDDMKMSCVPAFEEKHEKDASLCIDDGINLEIARIHTGDVDSSNALCEEIAKRWNGHDEKDRWYPCDENGQPYPNDPDIPKYQQCLLRIEFLKEDCGWYVEYTTAFFTKHGWSQDNFRRFENDDILECNITHWKMIQEPKIECHG